MTKQVQDAYIVAAMPPCRQGAARHVRIRGLMTCSRMCEIGVSQCPGLDTGIIDDVIAGCAMPEAGRA